jgi:hypothetical protein
MQSGELIGNRSIINLPLSEFNLSKGVYWLTLKIGNETTRTKLIIN